jgi:hypothetical protein
MRVVLPLIMVVSVESIELDAVNVADDEHVR